MEDSGRGTTWGAESLSGPVPKAPRITSTSKHIALKTAEVGSQFKCTDFSGFDTEDRKLGVAMMKRKLQELKTAVDALSARILKLEQSKAELLS